MLKLKKHSFYPQALQRCAETTAGNQKIEEVESRLGGSFEREHCYRGEEAQIFVRPGEPTQVVFPGEIKGGFKRKDSALTLERQSNYIVMFTQPSLDVHGESLLIVLEDERSYPLRVLPAHRKQRDSVVRLVDMRRGTTETVNAPLSKMTVSFDDKIRKAQTVRQTGQVVNRADSTLLEILSKEAVKAEKERNEMAAAITQNLGYCDKNRIRLARWAKFALDLRDRIEELQKNLETLASEQMRMKREREASKPVKSATGN